MRRAILILACWLVAWGAASAVNTPYYVDLACPTAGTGVSVDCGATGPKKTLPTGRALLAGQGDSLNVRGIHSAHPGCPGSTTGRYTLDDMDTGFGLGGSHFVVNGLNGASGNPIVIRPFGSEKVFIDGIVTTAPATRCTGTWPACATPCEGLNRAPSEILCGDVWWYSGEGMGHFSLLPTGDPTYRVANLWDMSNAHTSTYTGKVCSGTGNEWMRCLDDTMCPTAMTCSVTHAEIDSVGNNSGGIKLCSLSPHPCSQDVDCPPGAGTCSILPKQWVRWGASGPPTGAYPVTATNYNGGMPFWVAGSSSWVTIQGLIFRGHARPGYVVDIFGAPQHIAIDGNQNWYTSFTGGPDYSMAISGNLVAGPDISDIRITNNLLYYSASESLHTDANVNSSGAGDANGPMAILVQNNFMIGAGHPAVVMNHKIRSSTAQCMIIGNGTAAGGTGLPPKYAGSDISGNLCSDFYAWGGDVLGSCYGECVGGSAPAHTPCAYPNATPCTGGGTCSGAGNGVLRCRDDWQDCPAPHQACQPAAALSDYHGRGSGIVLENAHIGPTAIHDNIFRRVAGFTFEPDCLDFTQGISLVDYYNNLSIDSMSYNNSNYCSITFNHNGGCVVDQVKIFNNTSYGSLVRPQLCKTGSGSVTNMKYRNNLHAGTWTGTKLIDWNGGGAASGNSFQNNLLFATGGGLTTASTIATIGGVNFNQPGGLVPWVVTRDVDGDAVADSNKWGDPGWTPPDTAIKDFRLHPFDQLNQPNPAIDAGTMTGMPARTGIHNTVAAARGLPNYTRLQSTNISASPDIGAWEMLLQDGGFESGSMDGPWCVKIRDSGTVSDPVFMTTTNPILGARSVVLSGTGGTSIPCVNCRASTVAQFFTGLVVGRAYSLTGKWRLIGGSFSAEGSVDFGAFVTASCPAQTGCMQSVGCSATVAGTGAVDFVCPNLFTATDPEMGIEIRGNVAGQQWTLAIDNLELR